ncbi:ABC transporter permease [Haloglycomyces albus]|uniref:ABC transporter permease n=1 Tax=Haloglycomyces albus TaxID=526067 RepID=UPI00046D30DD|nr:ABC transporter permease [Haloglycomyces albus]
MLRHTLKRLLQLIPALLGLTVVLFIWYKLMPGGPEYALLPENASDAQREAMRESLGLNDSIWVQYGNFLKDIVTFDFGSSVTTGREVSTEIAERFPATLELGLAAMVLAIVVGVPLGYFAARKRGSLLDVAAVSGSLIGICTPVFFLAVVLKVIFAELLGWLPTLGRLSSGETYTDITGFRVLDGLLSGEFHVAWDAVQHLILPAMALASIPLAIITRITRASVLEVMDEDYVRTANAKGLGQTTVRVSHVMRNALLPVVTVVGLLFGGLFAGAVLTETVFEINGIGRFVYTATSNRDFPALLGCIMLVAVVFVLINLLVDLSYNLIDPRLRVK